MLKYINTGIVSSRNGLIRVTCNTCTCRVASKTSVYIGAAEQTLGAGKIMLSFAVGLASFAVGSFFVHMHADKSVAMTIQLVTYFNY